MRGSLVCLLIHLAAAVSWGLPWSGDATSCVRFEEATFDADGPNTENDLASAEAKIADFLEATPTNGKFHVQGWRWHTMSLVREADRLNKLATKLLEKSSSDEAHSLEKEVDYVVGFNMKGLHKIERDLFFPWVRKKMELSIKNPEFAKAFSTVMNQLEGDRQTMETLGMSLAEITRMAADSDNPSNVRMDAYDAVASMSATLAKYGRAMLEREDKFLVPAVANIVPESEQKSFNNKVIRNLGVFDSRVHLVGMHEAVWQLDKESERKLFDETIPSIPRKMIPRWKRLLYEPAIGKLNDV
jgi:hypothetical protein